MSISNWCMMSLHVKNAVNKIATLKINIVQSVMNMGYLQMGR